MAHFSYPSPDSRWALAVEMDYQPVWQRCRLVPLDGSSPGRPVGPEGQCTAAGWSPDGRWMYLGVSIDGRGQLWRQRFPDGTPEPLTSGPSEAAGIAVDPGGQSLITSLGVKREALWLREPAGERPISTQGNVFSIMRAFSTGALQGWAAVPMFSRDGRHLYYLHRREPSAERSTLRRTEIASGRTEDVSGEFSVLEFDISGDGSLAAFSTGGGSEVELWVTPVDRSATPTRVFRGAVAAPQFGRPGELLFRFSDGRMNHLYRMNLDGTGLRKAVPYPIATMQGASPDGRWVAALLQDRTSTHLLPIDGGEPVRLCSGGCATQWSPDGRYLYVSPRPEDADVMVALPVPPGESIPRLPPGGIRSVSDAQAMPGAVIIEKPEVTPGLEPTTYAYVKTTSQWNLYRVPLP
jgi:Tol biopolymer transport system component